MKHVKYFTTLVIILLLNTSISAQNLLHNFEFNGNLNDSKGSGVALSPFNVGSQSFATNPNSWSWTQANSPGGGLVLLTNQLPDPQSYSLGFRIEFDNTGNGYRKIVSFKGQADDNGLYFHNNNLVFYPFGENTNKTYVNNTFYDFVFVRNSSDNIKVYIVEANGTVTQVYDETDATDASVPHQVGSDYEFRFFMNDNVATEHTPGGTVQGIRLWDAPLSPGEIAGALSSVTTGDVTRVTSETATVTGEVNPQGTSANFEFEYGETTAYGQTLTATPASGSGSSAISVQATLIGLKPKTTYHYRLKSTNVSGAAFGSDQTFTTLEAPGGIAGAVLWLDASDPDADDIAGNNPADGADVTTWADKSGNGNNVTAAGISQGGVNPPSYLYNQFNGQAALRFDKANSEALGKILSSNYLGDFTVLIVLQGQTSSPVDFESFFSSWNDPNNAGSFQIDYNSGSSNFQVRTTDGNVAFGPFNQELDLFTVRQENTNLETYSDGVLQNNLNVSTAKGFNAYRIGINRNAGSFYDSKIAEVIIYPRALTACEMEQVNDYLGEKYGRDYYDIAANFDFGTSYPDDITGIGAFASACTAVKTINEAISSILTINNPSSNDTQGEFLTIAHDAGQLSTTGANLPVSLSGKTRLAKSWKADRDGDVGTVDMAFDLTGLTGIGTQASDFKLLVDTDGDGNFLTGTVQTIDVTNFGSNIVRFNGVNLPDNAVFTIALGLTAGPGVNGASLWLKADEGVTKSGTGLTGWTDQTGTNTFAVIGSPTIENNKINFNSQVTFDNQELPQNLPGDYLQGDTPISYVDGFAVFKKNNTISGTLVGSANSKVSYGSAIFAGNNTQSLFVGDGVAGVVLGILNPILSDQLVLANIDIGSVPATANLNGESQTVFNDPPVGTTVDLIPLIGGTNNVGGALPADGFRHFRGEVAEVIMYPSSLSLADKNKIQSYLAIKYGISLDPSIGSYVNSSGATIWNDATYWHDVFGLGKDDASSLNQTQSNSINTGSGDGTGQSGLANIVLSNPSSLDDGDFLLIGHDNAVLTEQSTELPSYYNGGARLGREWKVIHTGNVGTVDLQLNIIGLSVSGTTLGQFKLLLDSDGDFTSGATEIVPSSYASNRLTFTGITLTDDIVFTLVTNKPAIEAPVVTAVSGDAEVALSWNLPNLGGRTFDSYTIRWRVQGTSNFIDSLDINNPNTTSTIVTGLTNCTSYEFSVRVKASGDYSTPGYATATLIMHTKTYTVTSASITGLGSFTEAIDMANNNCGVDTIEFTPGLQVDASVPSVTIQTSIMAKITESVLIDGKGGALNGIQNWIDASGQLNSLSLCPGDESNTIQMAYMPGFLEIGTFEADNSGIDVTVKNLSIKQFNQVAVIQKNASLVLDNFTAIETWATFECLADQLITGHEGVSLTIRDSKFIEAYNWADAGIQAAAIQIFPEAGDLTIERSVFKNIYGGDNEVIYWGGKTGSKVNIVSSRFHTSGGIFITGESETNIVNTIWANNYYEFPKIGDKFVNNSSEDINLIASSFVFNENECDGNCQAFPGFDNFFEIAGSGNINFIQSAVGFNWDPTPGAPALNTLGINGGSGVFTADEYTWIQATDQQGAAALKSITSQSNLLTELLGFNRGVVGFTNDWDIKMATPAFPGELIDVIPSGNSLINPIDGSTITLDVVGNPRADDNGMRDIGALQLGLAPFLAVDTTGDGFVKLVWTKPLHHDGFSIIRYEVEYDVSGGSSPTTINQTDTVQVVSGLTNGTAYEFKVRAVYDAGSGVEENGPFSNTVTETPYGVTATPVVTATPGNAEVNLSWNQPDLNGNRFLGYIIQWGKVAPFWEGSQYIMNDYNATSITVSGLTSGTEYVFSVKVNSLPSPSVGGTATATPYGPIAAPVVTAVPGDTEVALFWNQPDLNGNVFADYIIQWSKTAPFWEGSQVINDINTLSTTVTGLTNCTSYVFSVKVSATPLASLGGIDTATPVGVTNSISIQPPTNDSIIINTIDSLVVVATGVNITYQWEVSSDSGTSYTAISDGTNYSGSTTDKLKFVNVPLSFDGNLYRVIVGNSTSLCSADTSTATTLNVLNPDWIFTKLLVNDPKSFNSVGDTLVYYMGPANIGNVSISNINVSDPAATSPPTLISGDTNSDLILSPGETWTYASYYIVTQADIDSGSVTNIASATGTPAGGTLNDVADTVTVSAVQSPDWIFEKMVISNPASFDSVGDTLVYYMGSSNTGNVSINNITVSDPGATSPPMLISGDTNSDLILSPGETWTYASYYIVTQADIDAGSYTNIASATGTPAGGTLNDVADTVTVSAVQSPDWIFEKMVISNPASFDSVGDTLVYYMGSSNTGNVSINNITVSDPGATSPPMLISGDTNSDLILSPGETWTYASYYIVTQADIDSGSVTNIASASGTPAGGILPDVSDTVTVNAIQNPDIQLAVTADKTSYSTVGELISYKILATNTGNVTFDSISYTSTVNSIDIQMAALAPGEKDSITVSYAITQADIDFGSLTLSSVLKGIGPSGLPVFYNQVLTIQADQRPEFDIVKTVIDTSYSSLQTLQFAIKITNTGNATIGQVALIDSLTQTFKPLADMGPHEEYFDTLSYTVTQDDLDAGTLTNIATVVGRMGNNGLVITDSDTISIGAKQYPSIQLEKTADSRTYEQETHTVTYNFAVTNTGNVTLRNVTINDPLTSTNHNLGIILPGNVRNYSANYDITQADIDAGSLTNIASVSGIDFSNNTVSDLDTVTITAIQNSSITLIKEVREKNYNAEGDVLHYTVAVENTGNTTLTNVQISDALIGINTNLASMIPGAIEFLTGTHTVVQMDIDTGRITNTATASALTPTGQSVFATDNAIIIADQHPSVDLSKSADKTSYQTVGEVITYSIEVENTGNVSLYNATISDPLTGLSQTISTMPPGFKQNYNVSHTITQDDIDTARIINTASVSATDYGGAVYEANDDATVVALQAPHIEITKTVNPSIVEFAGDVAKYYFEVRNTGNVTLSNVQINDPRIPFTDSKSQLLPGETWLDSAMYTLTQADIDSQLVINIADLTATAPDGSTVSAFDRATLAVKDLGAIEVVKTALTKLYEQPGDLLDFQLEVTNIGNVDLATVVLSDSLTGQTWNIGDLAPGQTQVYNTQYAVTQTDIDSGWVINRAWVTGVEATPSARIVSSDDYAQVKARRNASIDLKKTASANTYDTLGEAINFTLVLTNTGNVTLSNVVVADTLTGLVQNFTSLAPGASETIITAYTITQADLDRDSLINSAMVSAITPKQLTIDDKDSDILYAQQSPSISVSKTADRTVYSAITDVVNYTITLENTGNVTLDNVRVEDPLIGISDSLIVLIPGETRTITGTYNITQTDIDHGELINAVAASGWSPQSQIVYDIASLKLNALQRPDVEITKVSDKSSYSAVGELLTFTLTVENTGNVSLNSIKITDPLAGFVAFEATMAPQAIATYSMNYTVKQSDLDAGELMNTAFVLGADPGQSKISDSDTVYIQAVQNPLIALTKTAVPTNYAAVGDWVDYILRVENTGNVTLNNITVTDPLTGLNKTYATLEPSLVKTMLQTYFVSQADIDRGEIVNVAQASALDPNNNTLNASDSARVVALQAPSITLEKTVNPHIVENQGDVVEYKLQATNTGNVTLTNVEVNDSKIAYSQTIPQLLPGEVWVDSVDYSVLQSDIDSLRILNVANVSATAPNSAIVLDKDKALVVVIDNAAIEVVKTTIDHTYSAPGDRVRFYIEVTNIGNITLSNVEVTDSLTGQMWTIASLPPGLSQQYLSVYNITQDDIDRGTVVNTARATATEATPLGGTVQSEDNASSTALRNTAFDLVKTSQVNTYSAVGEVIPYTLEVTNIGNVTLTDLLITDSLTGTSQLFPSLAPQASESVNGSYIISQEDLDNGKVINTAYVTGNELVLSKSTQGVSLIDSASFTVFAVQSPVIEILKTANKTNYSAAGETVDFMLTVNNTGNVSLNNVLVTDTLTGTSQSIPSLAPASSETILLPYTIKQVDMDKGTLLNIADVSGVSPQSVTVVDDASVTLNANQTPLIELVKTANVNNYSSIGEVITYTMVITNTGNVSIDGVTITDPLTGTNYNAGTLLPSESESITATYTIGQIDIDAGEVINTASAAGTDPGGNPITANSSVRVVALQAPAVEFEKTADQSIVDLAGDTIIYTFTTTNTGNVTLSDVKFSDPKIPYGKTKTVLVPGETWIETASYIVTQADIDNLLVSNTAGITAQAPDASIVSSQDKAVVAVRDQGAIELVKTTGTYLYSVPGEIIDFDIVVTNIGNVTLTGVVVNDSLTGQTWNIGDMLPGKVDSFTTSYVVNQTDIDNGSVVNTAKVNGIEATPSARPVSSTDQASSVAIRTAAIDVSKMASVSTYSAVGESITYTLTVENTGNVTLQTIGLIDTLASVNQTIASMSPGSKETITATYTITQEDLDRGYITNILDVTALSPSNNLISSQASETILATQAPAIDISKTADKTVYSAVGENVDFKVVIENTGNVTLSNIQIHDPMTGLSLTWPLLAPGEIDSVTTTYAITQIDLDIGFVKNLATVTAISPQNTQVSANAFIQLNAIQMPDVELEKTASRTNYDSAGDLINYSIKVRNTGNVTLNNVQVSDPLTNTLVVINSIAPANEQTVAAAYFVKQFDVDNGSLTNVAEVVANDPSNVQVTDADTVTLTALLKPFIDVTKTANKASFSAVGELIQYTISIENTGNETMNNIQVDDPLTGLSEFIDTLKVTETQSFAASYTVTQADLDNDTIVNIARAVASDPANTTITDSDTLTVHAVQNPQINLTSSGIVDCSTIHYTYVVTNTGNVTLKDVLLEDTPIGLSQNIGILAPMETQTVQLAYRVSNADYNAGQVNSLAVVRSLDPKGQPVETISNLSIPVKLDRTYETVTACDRYTWNGKTYFNSGVYVDTLLNSMGCNLVATLNLTINRSSVTSISVNTCGNYTWDDGNTYTETGTYIQRFQNAIGCDSLSVLNLIIRDELNTVTEITECNSYTWTDGITYTQSGTYTQHLTASNGCDSITTLILTVLGEQVKTETAVSCESYVGINGNAYDQSGIYEITTEDQNGCEIKTILHLTILDEASRNIDTMVCDSFITLAGRVIYESGTYEEPYSMASLCDCKITYRVIVNKPLVTSEEMLACEKFTWDNGITYTESGIYTDTLTSEVGCDSIAELHLTILEPSYTKLFVAECDSFVAPDGSIYKQSGNYIAIIDNSVGCDSTIAIDLVILDNDTTVIDTTVCDEFTTLNGTILKQSGVVTETHIAASGCTKVVTYTITVNYGSEKIIQEIACESFTWIDGETYTESGQYPHLLINSIGCDSLLILDLSILKATTATTKVTAFDSYTWSDGTTYSESGTYSQLLSNSVGCDSVDILELIVVPSEYCAPTLVNPIQDTVIYADSTVLSLSIDPQHVFDVCSNGEIDAVNFMQEDGSTLPDWINVEWNGTVYSFIAKPTVWDLGCVNVVVEAVNQLGTASDTFSICVDGYYPNCPPGLRRPIPNTNIIAEQDTLNLKLSLLDDELFGSCRHEDFSCMSILLDDGRILPDWISVSRTDTAYFLSGIPSIQDTGCWNIVAMVSDAYGIATDTFQLCVDEACSPVLLEPISDTTLSINNDNIQEIALSLMPGDIFESCDTVPFDYTLLEVSGNQLPNWMTVMADDSVVIIECLPTVADTGCVELVLTVYNSFGSASDTFEVCAKDITVGIENPEQVNFEVSMYPNPTNGIVNIEIEEPVIGDVEIMVRSINGQEVYREMFISTNRISFDLSKHVSGMYLIQIKTSEQQVLKKLILDRK